MDEQKKVYGLNPANRPHLTLDGWAAAVYDRSDSIMDYEAVKSHVAGCIFCSDKIERERKRNNLYQAYIKSVPSKMSKEEFWEQIEEVGKGLVSKLS